MEARQALGEGEAAKAAMARLLFTASDADAGLPLLAGATVHLICAVASLITVGDHELVVGRVLQADLNQPSPPLLHHRGQFTRPESA